VLELYFTVILI